MAWWIVPFPYDYHHQAELIVRADTPEAALERVKTLAMQGLPSCWFDLAHQRLEHSQPMRFTADDVAHVMRHVRPEHVRPWDGDWYFNSRCDC